jgi:hypothetical protein
MTKITLVTAIVVAVLMLFSRFGRAGTQDETAAVDKDAQVLAQLRAAGSNVEKPHQLEFFFYLPTQEKAAAIATVLGHDASRAGCAGPWMAELRDEAHGSDSRRTRASTSRIRKPRRKAWRRIRWVGNRGCEVACGLTIAWSRQTRPRQP